MKGKWKNSLIKVPECEIAIQNIIILLNKLAEISTCLDPCF